MSLHINGEQFWYALNYHDVFFVIVKRQESAESVTERRTRSDWASVWQPTRGIVSYQASLAYTESFQRGLFINLCSQWVNQLILVLHDLLCF